MAADLDLWDFELSEAEMKAISAVGEGGRAHLHATVEPPSSRFKAQELHLIDLVGGHHRAGHMLRAPVLVFLLCLLLLKCVSSYDKVAVSPYEKVAVVAPAPEKVAAMAPVPAPRFPAPRRNLAGAGAPVGPRRGRRINNFNPVKYKLSLCHRLACPRSRRPCRHGAAPPPCRLVSTPLDGRPAGAVSPRRLPPVLPPSRRVLHRWRQPIPGDGKLIWSRIPAPVPPFMKMLGEHPPTPTRRQSKATLV